MSLMSDDSAVIVPDVVTVRAPSTTFQFTTRPVENHVTVRLWAIAGVSVALATVYVMAPTVIDSLRFEPARVIGGVTVVGMVALRVPAPTGGVIVALSSNATDLVVPATVVIPAGERAARFDAVTRRVSAETEARVTASAGGSELTAEVRLLP